MTTTPHRDPPREPGVIVLLDVLGTTVDFHPERRLAALAARTGRDPTYLQHAIWESGFDARCDLGALQPAEMYAQLTALIGMDIPPASLEAAWAAALGEALALPTIRALGELHHVVFWSNNGPLMDAAIRRSQPGLLACGDAMVCSWQLGARKESEQAQPRLRAHLAALGLPAEAQLVVVDDDVAVISAMRAFGYRTIRCPDGACLDAILQAFFPVNP